MTFTYLLLEIYMYIFRLSEFYYQAGHYKLLTELLVLKLVKYKVQDGWYFNLLILQSLPLEDNGALSAQWDQRGQEGRIPPTGVWSINVLHSVFTWQQLMSTGGIPLPCQHSVSEKGDTQSLLGILQLYLAAHFTGSK